MSELLEATGRRLAELLGAEAARVTPGRSRRIALGNGGVHDPRRRRGGRNAFPRRPACRTRSCSSASSSRTTSTRGSSSCQARSSAWSTRATSSSRRSIPARVAAAFVPAHLDELPGALPLREVAALARERGIPTLADAAFLNYPPESMRRFTAEGADLVCFSAKYFYGPNTGGFVVGRADLVDAVAAVDFTNFETGRWAKYGRPFKLDLHTVVGTTLAVEEWFAADHEARWRSYAELVDRLEAAVANLPGVRTERRFFTMVETLEDEPVNCLVVHSGRAAEAERALWEANPRIAVHRWDDTMIVAVDTLLPEQCDVRRRPVAGRSQRKAAADAPLADAEAAVLLLRQLVPVAGSGTLRCADARRSARRLDHGRLAGLGSRPRRARRNRRPDPRASTSTGPRGATRSLQFRNCGIYGQRTDEIARRLEDCAAGADVLDRAGRDQRHRATAPGRAGGGQPSRDGRPRPRAGATRPDRRRPALEQRLSGRRGADPAPERADPRARHAGAALPRHAGGPGAAGPDARGVDVGRRPPFGRGLPAARRGRCPRLDRAIAFLLYSEHAI